jgi:hypothetical protein
MARTREGGGGVGRGINIIGRTSSSLYTCSHSASSNPRAHPRTTPEPNQFHFPKNHRPNSLESTRPRPDPILLACLLPRSLLPSQIDPRPNPASPSLCGPPGPSPPPMANERSLTTPEGSYTLVLSWDKC